MADKMLKQEVLALLIRDTQTELWRSILKRMTLAYQEGFAAVSNDPRILSGQKPAKLLDERFYLAERALHDAATDAGALSSGQKIEINNWVYTLVRSNGVCLVQCYVKSPQDFARPAKFREQHAALNSFLSRPQFAFGDIPPGLFDVAAVAGIIIHGPMQKAFDEQGQRLGFLNFAVPSQDYRDWEINIPVPEIVSTLEAQASESTQRDIAQPNFRTDKRRIEGKESA